MSFKSLTERFGEYLPPQQAQNEKKDPNAQTEQGNADTLAVLRSRQQTRRRLAEALLTAENVEAAQHLILPHLKPFTRKNWDVCYRLKDGGRVEDTDQAVYVPEVTEASALLALTLAQERFTGKALIVEGSTAFKVKVAEMAVIKGLNVQFADPEMEKTRERFELARQNTPIGSEYRSHYIS